MKFLIVAALLAAASAQFFCPDSEASFQCLETQANTAYCMNDGNWVCGKCEVKRLTCFGGLKQARYESECADNDEPTC